MASRRAEISPREMALTASSIQTEVDEAGLGRCPATPATPELEALYDALVLDKALRSATRRLFLNGHYANAVEEAYKCLSNAVKRRVNTNLDGPGLMRTVFSPDAPCLRLNSLKTTSQRDQQEGYMHILAGCMLGIRNPRAHAHGHDDDPQAALEMLAWANHLMRLIASATRTRRKPQK